MIQDALNNCLYDAEGRLCAVENILAGSTTEYVYDADSRRVAKGSWAVTGWPVAGQTWTGTIPSCATPTAANGFTLTALYLRGGAGDQDVEIDPAQGSNPAGWHQNVFANGGLLATYTQSGTAAPALYFSFNDWLGTKRLEVNASGQAVNYWGSDPFGDYLTPHVTTPDPSEHHFTGKERDAESGLDYFGARYYASSMGRWMSPDWSAKEEPVPYAKLDNPQSLNLYAYMENNPLGGIDADGHEIVQLGQHTDKEIAQQTADLNKQLQNKDLSAADKSTIQGKIQTLATEKEGNAVGNAFLARLNAVGEGGNLKLSDLSVTTDPANDFKGKASDADLAHLASPSVKGFVLEAGGQIYLTQSSVYNDTINPDNTAGQRRQFADIGGAIVGHERNHREGGNEAAAQAEGGRIFQKFKPDFSPGAFNQWNRAVSGADQ